MREPKWRDFTPIPRPKGMRKRADKACYLNALRVVLKYHPAYTYAEGLAWGAELGIPIHHAWVVDGRGNAIDPTWREPGSRYHGVTFDLAELTNLGGPAIDCRLVLRREALVSAS